MRIQRPNMAMKSRRGAYTVEFAIVSPVLFLLIFSMVEFSRMVMVQQAITNAAREGCRTATLATTRSTSKVDEKIRDYLKAVTTVASDSDLVKISTSPADLYSIAPGTEITCEVKVQFSDVSWLPPQFLKSVVLNASSTMERE